MIELLRDIVPFVLPVAAGYALAQYGGLTPASIRIVLRFVFFPALLFFLMLARVPPRTFLFVAPIGAAMVGVGWLVVNFAPRMLKPRVNAAAAVPNLACFALPFLTISWARAGLGTACALFVGASITLLCIQAKRDSHKALVREPWVYAFLAALVLRLVETDPGVVVTAAVSPLAIGSIALLLVFLGASLYPFDLNGLKDPDSWATVVVRVMVGLAVGLLAIILLPVARGVMEAIVVCSLAPPATRALSMVGPAPKASSSPASVALGTVVSLVAMIILLVIDW